jgi:hypothetical protein
MFSSTKLENKKVEQVLYGGVGEEGWQGVGCPNNVYTYKYM